MDEGFVFSFIRELLTVQKIDSLDIILTESQFKMGKQYHELNNENSDTWNFYQNYCVENGNTWAVSKVNPKEEKKIGNTNYQFLQTLELEKADILSLCKPSKEFIEKCFNDPKTALEMITHEIDGVAPSYVQAVNHYPDAAVKDPYIAKKIYETVKGQIQDMCLGRLRIEGNYQFMISDPVAFCEWAFYGDEDKVKGLLKENEYYSKYWLDKKVNKVSALRAPNIHFSEHNTLNLVNNPDMELWYSHLPSGIIYNIFGDDDLKHSGSDRDGDIVFCSSSNELLNGTVISPVIDFEHEKAEATLLTNKELFKADKIGFTINIGRTVNFATICINMMANYAKDSEEYVELERRAKILTFIGQQTIDAQKGCEVSKVPEYWYKYRPILTEAYYQKKYNKKSQKQFNISLGELKQKTIHSEDETKLLSEYEEAKKVIDDETTTAKKNFNNSILLNKKPYFFIYKEKTLKTEYKDYQNILSLRNSEHAINPINDGNSLMNIVCKEIEQYNNDSRFAVNSKHTSTDKDWIAMMKRKGIRRSTGRYNAVSRVLKAYAATKRFVGSELGYADDDKIISHSAVDDCYKNLFYAEVESEAELANILIELLYEKSTTISKAALWKFAGNAVVENIKNNTNNTEVAYG